MVEKNTDYRIIENIIETTRIKPEKVETDRFKEQLRFELLKEYMAFRLPVEQSRLPFWRSPQLFLGVCLLAFAGVAIFVGFRSNLINTGELSAIAAFKEGDVEFLNDQDVWVDLAENKVLKEGDQVRVNGEGKAILNLDDGSALRLRSNTAVTLTSMDANHITVKNDYGYLYSRVVESNRQFDVVVDEVIYTSIGTAYLTVNEPQIEGVEVYQNKIKVISEGLEVNEGQKYYVKAASGTTAQEILAISLEEIKKNEFLMWNREKDSEIGEFKDELGILSDLESPYLEIKSPVNNATVLTEKIFVQGFTEPGSIVTVNGTEIPLIDGVIDYELTLQLGENVILIKSTDEAGNFSESNLLITREEQTNNNPTSQISLNGAVKNGIGISFIWSLDNVKLEKGFKLLKSKDPNPTYPEDEVVNIDNNDTRTYTWNIQDGGTYYFRVCQFLNTGKCGIYSNNLSLKAPSKVNPVQRIELMQVNGGNMSWNVTGYSEKGFLLIWSENPDVKYESGESQWYNQPDTRSGQVIGTSGKTYYVKVCEYVNNKCGIYSNEVQISL